MTDVAPPYPHPASQPEPKEPRKRKRRIFLWVFLVLQLLFVVLVIVGIASGNGQPDAKDCIGLSAKDCNAASDVGTGLGVVVIFVLWFCVDAFVGLIYGIYRLARRPER